MATEVKNKVEVTYAKDGLRMRSFLDELMLKVIMSKGSQSNSEFISSIVKDTRIPEAHPLGETQLSVCMCDWLLVIPDVPLSKTGTIA